MTKRGRDTLTGGTHDVNPQFMNIPATYTDSTTTATTTSYVMPKSPLTQNGRAQIIELLKIWYEFGGDISSDSSQTFSISVNTSTPPSTEVKLSDAKCIAKAKWGTCSTAAGLLEHQYVISQDLTDGAGHGVLVATDNLYIQCYVGSQATSTTQANVKILYRYKNVSVQEYIGIVQSQN